VSLIEFLASRPFDPDQFQRDAAGALETGSSVLVTAPTGSGKTLVAEMAVHLARRRGRRCFYTTPIKALSNQKYGDLVDEYGPDEVGLLTGDNVINPRAGIIVMTTEVLRNMIYADASTLDDVEFVILDEVHYLQDRFRGAVWEEVIIHAPAHVKLVCLSATVANAEEFAAWLTERRSSVELVVSAHRPVPLERLYLLADRYGEERLRLYPLLTVRDGRERPNSRLEHLLSLEKRGRVRFSTPGRIETIQHLAGLEMLPAIYFIFSRTGCDSAVRHLVDAGLQLIEPDQRTRIRAIVEERTEHLGDRDLAALGYGTWVAGLETGVASHHAGLVPAFKETVEELFRLGLVKVVFATETLALGINMPARTVVLEALSKYDGEGHSLLGPGDFTQLTGRAGRRGIDDIGYGVTLHTRFVRFDQVVQIASTGSNPLRSSFRPTYNMAANLVANYSRERADELLTASFAQFQRRGAHTEASARLAEMEDRLPDEMARAECDLGSVAEYVGLLDAQEGPPGTKLAGRLQPGDVIEVPGGPRAGRFVVLRKLNRGKKGMRFLVMGTTGRVSNISGAEVVAGSFRSGTIALPAEFRANDRKFQSTMQRRLRAVPVAGEAPSPVGAVSPDHPVAACPRAAEHVKAWRRAARTEKRTEQLRSQLRQSGVGLVEEFHAIQQLLEDWAYVTGWSLTARGERLRFLYNESDLLLTESTERGLFWNTTPQELAALMSVFVFEPRTEEPSVPVWPTPELEMRYQDIEILWQELARKERSLRLPVTRRPDPGFLAGAWDWANLQELDDIADSAMAPGDFVRVCRQLVDLLRQVRDNVPELAADAAIALRLMDRGVVAAQGTG
jgi:ATP-dependent RNA helicase HelY